MADMFIASNTELDAVNTILGAVGESPVNTIEDPTNVDVINAIRELSRTSREEQSKGYSFNIIPKFTINPDTVSNKIRWSSTFLRLTGTDGTRYVKRGEYLFNFDKQTDVFTAPIEVECILLVPFDELPEPMRNYITAKAAYAFQSKFFNDEALSDKLAQAVAETRAALNEYELDTNKYNLLNNAEIRQIVQR